MDKKIIFILLIASVILVSGCTVKTGTSGNETGKNGTGTGAGTTIKPTVDVRIAGQDLDPTKRCGSGEAIQGFDLTDRGNPDCISISSGATSTPTGGSDTPANGEAHHDHWGLRIDGDSNTDSTVGSGAVVDLQSGAGISLLKDGNTVTIASTLAPVSPATSDSNTTSSTWTLTTPFAKIGKGGSSSISVGDGDRVNIKGSGATSVSINSANKEVTISSPVVELGVWIGNFGPDFTLKNGDNLKISGSNGISVTRNVANKEVIISGPDIPNVKQYQYRTVRGWCQKINGNWAPYHEGTGINLVLCGKTTTAQCTVGRIINYGGRCQRTGSNRNAIQYLSPEHLAIDDDAYSTSWSNLPTIKRVKMVCRESDTSYVNIWLTCMREKP